MVVGSVFYWAKKTGLPFYPSSPEELKCIIQLLREAQPIRGPIYELGCGFGHVARVLAKAFPESRIVGVEISPVAVLLARLLSLPYRNVVIRRADFLDESMATDFSEAGAITCHLITEIMPRLATRLDAHVRNNTPVVSVVFRFSERQETSALPHSGPNAGTVRLYRWPAKKPKRSPGMLGGLSGSRLLRG